MPELPEVETMVRDLRPRIVGQRITSVEAEFPGSVIWPRFEQFRERVANRPITGIWRRGKYAIFDLAPDDALVVHRGMSGSLLLRSAADPMEKYIRVMFHLEGGESLRFTDPRKFGKVFLLDRRGGEYPLPWSRLGPEPLESGFTAAYLRDLLSKRKAPIKSLLLNQEIVAGLGNIYVDEALYVARIHPLRRANTIKRSEVGQLREAIQAVLLSSIEGRGTSFNSYVDIGGRRGSFQEALQVFRKTDAPCLRCGKPIQRLVVAGRGTHVCPKCQKL